MSKSSRNLTLREVFEKHYRKADLAEASVKSARYHISVWERMTDNPKIGDVDNDTVEQFRQAMLDADYAAKSINTVWITLRAIFRRLAPAAHGNPHGLGIIDQEPVMRKVREKRKYPHRAELENLSRFYIASAKAQKPSTAGCPPGWYWQALICTFYFTGLRKEDVLLIRLDDVDFDRQVIDLTTHKTWVEMEIWMHPVLVQHLRRIVYPRELLFPHLEKSYLNKLWRGILDEAGIKGKQRFTPHDIRRTGASEINRIKPGLGDFFLGHAPKNVSEASYINSLQEVREAVAEMRVPLAFKHGVGLAERHEIKALRKRQERLHVSQFGLPRKPAPSEFQFAPNAFWLDGKWRSMKSGPQWRVLKALAEADGPVGVLELAEAVWGESAWPREWRRVTGRVNNIISELRNKLRIILAVDDTWNPVPCTAVGRGGEWTLLFPPDLHDAGDTEAA